MNEKRRVLIAAAILIFGVAVMAQTPSVPPPSAEVRPPVTKADVQIVEHAQKILNSPSKWNRVDTRVCPAEAKTFSLYCALEKATYEVTGKFEHRGAAMQEARFVIEAVAPNWHSYQHRLMDYNNDPTTTFADIQNVFRLLQDRISKRLVEESSPSKK